MRVCRLLALMVLMAVLGGCGTPPTTSESGDETGGASETAEGDGEDAKAKLEDLYAQLEGKSLEERREILIPIAEEAGDVSLYGSMNGDEGPAAIEAFEDATGLSTSFYRASASTILQRVLQEHDAGFAGADAVFINGTEMIALDREGLLLPLQTPSTEEHPEEGVLENWAWTYVNAMVPMWNTEKISGDRVPKTWEDVLTKYDGELVMEIGDFDWFATLVTYFVEEKGMTEDEAVELFRNAAKGASSADGHTLMAELVAAGEFGIASSAYDLNARQLSKEGAPVTYDPVVEPAIVRPNGIGVFADSPNPAGALLWIDFILSEEGQQILADYERTPASYAIKGAGLPPGTEILPVALEEVFDERDKWTALYEEVVRAAGEPASDE